MNVAVTPGFAAFRAAYDAGRGALVWSRATDKQRAHLSGVLRGYATDFAALAGLPARAGLPAAPGHCR